MKFEAILMNEVQVKRPNSVTVVKQNRPNLNV